MGNLCADHVTPLYPQKLALTSPTGGGRSVGIVRSRTKATEFSLVFMCFIYICCCSFTVVNLNIGVIFFVIFLQKCLDFTCFSKAYLCFLVTSLSLIFYLHFLLVQALYHDNLQYISSYLSFEMWWWGRTEQIV